MPPPWPWKIRQHPARTALPGRWGCWRRAGLCFSARHWTLATIWPTSPGSLVPSAGITALPFPDLTIDAVTDQVIAFGVALDSAAGNVPVGQRQAKQQLAPILEWLWDHAVGPVLEALGPHIQPAPGLEWPQV